MAMPVSWKIDRLGSGRLGTVDERRHVASKRRLPHVFIEVCGRPPWVRRQIRFEQMTEFVEDYIRQATA